MLHQQGSAGMRYCLKKGQPRMIPLQWGLMHSAFYQYFTLLDFVLINDLQTREIAFVYDLTAA